MANICPCPYRIHDNGPCPSTGSRARIPAAPNAPTNTMALPAVPSAIVRTGSGPFAGAATTGSVFSAGKEASVFGDGLAAAVIGS
ncbi:hypothetical protein GCM10023148_00580 [Actinokineospora soli]